MKKKMTTVPFSGTPEQEAKLRKELKEIAKLEGCAMPALQKAQEIYGYLPMEVQKIVAEETGIPLEKIFGITTFYSQFALAPNGKFYICPAFYQEDEENNVGDLAHGLKIPNPQLYQLEYAPICRRCDAYQCKRCIWLNRKTTLEVNTPSREQCVTAHLERNASRQLLAAIRQAHKDFLPDTDIKEIDYLDPFEICRR